MSCRNVIITELNQEKRCENIAFEGSRFCLPCYTRITKCLEENYRGPLSVTDVTLAEEMKDFFHQDRIDNLCLIELESKYLIHRYIKHEFSRLAQPGIVIGNRTVLPNECIHGYTLIGVVKKNTFREASKREKAIARSYGIDVLF